ncbi:MAG TPA: 4Fe-4S dicluster domain-containing protein [Candidatus Methylomirabilis sp.]|jgi:MinD superfamily P-loop ATPase
MDAWALPEFDDETCDGCGECADACHAGAISIVEGKAAVTQPVACDYCTDCEAVCRVGAVHCPFEIVYA